MKNTGRNAIVKERVADTLTNVRVSAFCKKLL
jgi:hypothetical protein